MYQILPMAKRRNEIKTAMYSVVHNIPPVQTTFISQKPFKLVINVLYDSFKAKKTMQTVKIKNCFSQDII